MRRLILITLLVAFCLMPVRGAEFTAPSVPESAAHLMPEADSFGEGLWMIIQDLLPLLRPDLHEASRISLALIAAVILVSMLQGFSESVKSAGELAGAAAISSALLMSANAMISLGAGTVEEMSEYGKLLVPVMTAAMAAQGNVGTSMALNTGTTAFSTLLSALISGILIPSVYLYLALAAASAAFGEDMLKRLRDLIKNLSGWILKSMLTVFIGYMGITGVISGTADTAALKAAKTAISTAVPIVGGILSDASETVLISIGLAKNAAGLYGIFAVLAIFLEPFLRIGCHYLILKATAAVCGVFGVKPLAELVGDFSSALGLLLGMTGAVCFLLLIASACFMKGVA